MGVQDARRVAELDIQGFVDQRDLRTFLSVLCYTRTVGVDLAKIVRQDG